MSKNDVIRYLPGIEPPPLAPELRTWLQIDENKLLPEIPQANLKDIAQQTKKIMFLYATTPGIIGDDLTEDDLKDISATEAAIYNFIKSCQDPDVDFTKFKYLMDMVIGPPTQRTESLQVKGSIKDWRQTLEADRDSIDVQIQEAEAVEASKNGDI